MGALFLSYSSTAEQNGADDSMSKFQFPESIASRPVYGTLEPRPGKAHLMIADAEGAEAILELALQDSALMAKTHIIYIPKGTEFSDKLRALKPAQFYEGPSYDASVQRIRKVLGDAHMGLQVYLAGTEGLMGQAMNEAIS
ncbi:MAG: hypothetical protein DCO97_07575, partial [Marivita sp. XM-24bin2]